MNGTLLAGLGAFAGALVTAVASMLVSFHQSRRAREDERRARAFEQHLRQYEEIFVAARSTQDALHDYLTVEALTADRSDPFLPQLLTILSDCSYRYCAAVDWRHNPSMAYLDIKLEQLCLDARKLVIKWLSVSRLTTGDIASFRQGDVFSAIPLRNVRNLKVGDYQELRVERRPIVAFTSQDLKLASAIDRALTSVIVQLKAVISH